MLAEARALYDLEMASIVSTVHIAAPLDEVWAAASTLESHTEWMVDAESIDFETRQRQGVGTRMVVETRVGPLRTSDRMEVTEWEEGRAIGVRHSGLISGEGRFELTPMAGGTRFTWTESLTFPWWLGGGLTAWVTRPVLGWIWRRNLTALKHRLE